MKKIFKFSIIIISIIIFAYTVYRSEIVWAGDNREHYQKYYYLSFFLIFLSLINLFSRKIVSTYINIIFFSLIFSLYAIETFIVFNKKQINLSISKKSYKERTGKELDTRSKKEVYKDLQKIHKNVSLTTISLIDSKTGLNSLSGKSFSKTICCNENGYYMIIDSDRYGFNNPDYEWTKKTQDILMAGDSFLYGECVNRPNDIASVIRKKTKRNVISLGLPGNGPIRELASIKEYSTEKVKNIVWMYFEGNDLQDLAHELKNKTLKKYLINKDFSQNLKTKQKIIDEMVDKKINISSETTFEFKKFLKLNALRREIYNYQIKKENNLEDFKIVITELSAVAKLKNANLFFVYLPSYDRYYRKSYSNKNYNEVKKIILDENIYFIDGTKKIYEKENDPLDMFPFKLPGVHYTKETYEQISDLIIENIKKYE